MTPSRRTILRAGGLAFGGGALLYPASTTTAIAAETTADPVTIQTDDGAVSSLKIDALDIDFSWRGINDPDTDVNFALNVRLSGPDGPATPGNYEEVTTGRIPLDGEQGSTTLATDSNWAAVPWADDGTIDLLAAASPIASADFPTPNAGQTAEVSLDFELEYAHPETTATETVTVPLTIENTSAPSETFTATIDDDTTHTNMTGDHSVLYFTDIPNATETDWDEVRFSIDLTIDGNNKGGSGGYPSAGLRVINGSGDIVFRFNDYGTWVATGDWINSGDGDILVLDENTTHSTSAETDWHPMSELNAPLEGTLTVELFDNNGGGADSDRMNWCDATIEWEGRQTT